MAVIAVVGTSGVGKSFLVKQLASATCSPAFFEGEEGTIPADVLESVFSGKDPRPRWKFFISRYRKNLERARKVSDAGMDCFVDGSDMSAKAILTFEDATYKKELDAMAKGLDALKPDFTIVLTASKGKLTEYMRLRGRKTEGEDAALARALKIQDSFIALAKRKPDVRVVDRSQLDFTDPAHLQRILKVIAGLKG